MQITTYICEECGEEFTEPDEEYTTYESYYGVSSEFPDSTPLTLCYCPYCHSEYFHEKEEDEEEEYEDEEVVDYSKKRK